MRLSPLRLAIAAVVSTVAACTLNTAGLGSSDSGRVAIVVPDASGAAGEDLGAAGTSTANGGDVGSAGATSAAGSTGAAGSTDAAGSTGAAGSGTAGSTGGGPAGTGGAGGLGGAIGVAGNGAAGNGVAGATGGQGGTELPDAGGLAGSTGAPDAHPISPAGCSDGTREGFTSIAIYPDIAACAGGWQIPGFVGAATMSPACGRHGGNDGARPNGEGCSVADLCAEGWHVCEGSVEFATKATDCHDALSAQGGGPAFYGTRQRGPDKTCDPTNQTGTNNVYGCGNFGSPAMAACAPFTRMLRDADCKANTPWMCVDGPIDYNVMELVDVTKTGPERGGVLCCR